jgi:hypothetical protein
VHSRFLGELCGLCGETWDSGELFMRGDNGSSGASCDRVSFPYSALRRVPFVGFLRRFSAAFGSFVWFGSGRDSEFFLVAFARCMLQVGGVNIHQVCELKTGTPPKHSVIAYYSVEMALWGVFD